MQNKSSETILPSNKPVLIGIIALIVFVVGWFIYRTVVLNSDEAGQPAGDFSATVEGVFELDAPAPYFEFYDFSGNQLSRDQLSGKPIVLDFWAAWCVFCREEMPVLESIHQEMGNEVHIIGVHRTDTGETLERGAQFANEQSVTYTLIQDSSGALYKAVAQGLTAMPAAVFIDEEGIVRDIRFGPKTASDIREGIDEIR